MSRCLTISELWTYVAAIELLGAFGKEPVAKSRVLQPLAVHGAGASSLHHRGSRRAKVQGPSALPRGSSRSAMMGK